ncbi:putative GMP synthase [glutamine-hydrolyzing] [Sesamum alatum]|uniref:GMP synthase [glutamine-hydrolyzing] n=1 Tax=Sesamum alatum TaxID=300844 RepID=A0AAE1Z1S7_9LAMI|nr:putative GMP synthase [glutamine-hydrolyzing] [Sesamum alatum]
MCSSKPKLKQSSSMNGRAVLHPNSNRAPLLERRNSFDIAALLNTTSSPTNNTTSITAPDSTFPQLLNNRYTPPASPTSKPNIKKINPPTPPPPKSKSTKTPPQSSDLAPGSIAAARREQVAILHEQRKLRIAHYGRTAASSKSTSPSNNNSNNSAAPVLQQEKRCSFITPNSDPIYVAYHDEEWGVPVHDDKLLFELLVLTGAQVGSDWSSVLRKRQDYRDAFSGFDAEIVSKYSEKKMSWISGEYGIELSLIRGVVDNSKRILEINKEFGSFDKYLWGFVNEKPMVTQYKWLHKIPAKTSKSETISKDMVRRGFRLVGPTVIHSFMQAAGLTNDHLITCPRHSQCLLHAPTYNTT